MRHDARQHKVFFSDRTTATTGEPRYAQMDDGVNILYPGLDSAPGHHLKLKKTRVRAGFLLLGACCSQSE